MSPPLRGRAFPAGAAGSMPTVGVCGTRDPYCAPPELDALRTVEPGAVVEQIDGADHFFAGALEPLGAAVRRWLERWLPLRPAGVAAATAPPSRPTG